MRLRVGSTLALCLFTGLTIPLAAQEKADTATSIRKLEEKWTESYKKRQIDILSSLLAEDFVITVEDGNTYSKMGYITHSADRGLPRERQVQREALRVSRPAHGCMDESGQQMAGHLIAL